MSSSSVYPPDHGRLTLEDMRQPKVVRVEVNAESEDLNAIWHSLYKFLDRQFDNVDFEYRADKVTFFCYPRAIND